MQKPALVYSRMELVAHTPSHTGCRQSERMTSLVFAVAMEKDYSKITAALRPPIISRRRMDSWLSSSLSEDEVAAVEVRTWLTISSSPPPALFFDTRFW